jgi:hypothetical protein
MALGVSQAFIFGLKKMSWMEMELWEELDWLLFGIQL